MKYLKKHKFIIAVVAVVLIYFLSCSVLYLFEPLSYSGPDLNKYNEYFNMYSYYGKNVDENFYIKQISAKDIKFADNDVRLKYVDNTAIAVATDNVTFNDITTLLNDYDAEICGYIKDVNFYQIEFSDELSFEKLDNICKKLSDSDMFKIVLPDYFEEMPTDSEESTAYADKNHYYYDMINAYDAWSIYNQYDNDVNVGMIDVLVDYNNNLLNVANGDDYSLDSLNSSLLYGAESHGTHVAGIINADSAENICGLAYDADLCSYNGVNVSTSYWIASICDMILRKDVKVINISMGYNSYISISAQLGDTNAVEYINNENVLFSEILANAIKRGNEFVICVAAGNSTTTSLYKSFSSYFGYGDKDILSKLDVFNIFDSCPDYVDAEYSFFVADSPIEEVDNRIIVVGSVGENMSYTYFANAGSVDIAAPGEYIYSTLVDNEFGYMSGTSMATPFVSGTAAMMFTVNPELSGAQVKEIIMTSATESVEVNNTDYPVLDAGAAVSAATKKQMN
ncbi:MAG: S8 family serine peptidase [Clostridia bacterium]|nr:S8 family serine peptidase [Clostridia bacterium]